MVESIVVGCTLVEYTGMLVYHSMNDKWMAVSLHMYNGSPVYLVYENSNVIKL